MRSVLSAIALCACVSPACFAHEYRLGELTIGHPHTFATAESARAAAGYLTITNAGDEPDRLVGIRTDLPRAEVHATQMQDGVARMVPVDAVEIPPGETVTLEPGGLHVMLMGLQGPLEEGGALPLTLVFERSGDIEVSLSVEPRRGGHASGDHDGHGGTSQ